MADQNANGGAAAEVKVSFAAEVGVSTTKLQEMWEKVSVQTVGALVDADTDAQEAESWNQLEDWLLTEHSSRVRALSIEVARLELMMRSYNATLEAQFKAAGQAFLEHVEARIEAVVDATLASDLESVLDVELDSDNTLIVDEIKAQVAVDYRDALEAEIIREAIDIEGQIRADVRARIKTEIEEKVLELEGAWSTAVAVRLVGELEQNLIVEIVQQGSGEHLVELEAEVELAICRISNELTSLYNEARIWVKRGDEALYRWIVVELRKIRGCVTDRQTFVTAFRAFVDGLSDRLSEAGCVQVDRMEVCHFPEPEAVPLLVEGGGGMAVGGQGGGAVGAGGGAAIGGEGGGEGRGAAEVEVEANAAVDVDVRVEVHGAGGAAQADGVGGAAQADGVGGAAQADGDRDVEVRVEVDGGAVEVEANAGGEVEVRVEVDGEAPAEANDQVEAAAEVEAEANEGVEANAGAEANAEPEAAGDGRIEVRVEIDGVPQ